MAINHAEGWQKKGVAEALRDQRRVSGDKDLKVAARQIEQLHALKEGTKSGAAEKGAVPEKGAAPQPQRSPADHSAAAARPGAAVQAEAARLRSDAAEQFLKVKQDAKMLGQLEGRVARSEGKAVTRDAVLSKGEPQAANLGRQPSQHQPPIGTGQGARARHADAPITSARPTTVRGDGGRGAKAKGAAEGEAAKGMKPAAGEVIKDTKVAAASAASSPAASPSAAPSQEVAAGEKPRPSEAEGRKGTEGKKGSEARQAGGVYARPTNSGGELGALLGGFSGGGEGNESGSEAAITTTEAAPTAAEIAAPASTAVELPESDPDFHVFNHPEDAGEIADVKGKARLFMRFVEKRLSEIAVLDRMLDDRFKALSDRIVGEMREELKDKLRAADFHRSVYGGLIG